MNANQLIKAAASTMKKGAKFNLRLIGAGDKSTGAVIPCVVVDLVERNDWPVLLAHVGETIDVTMLHLSVDQVEGATLVTAIGVCGSDAATDYGYPAEMLSDEWAGSLFAVLD